MFEFSIKIYTTASVILISVLFTSSLSVTSSELRTYKVLEGDNILVICNITDIHDIYVFWTKNDTKSHFLLPGKRLEILDIKRSYSGEYICHAMNTSLPVHGINKTDVNKTIEVIKIDVQYPGEIDTFYAGPYELIENQTFSITCNFQGNPDPTWSIRNRDNGLTFMSANLSASATLTSPPATCDYTGYWECTGKNKLNHGENMTRGHNITVFCAPRPQYGKNQYIVQSTVGQSTQLKMFVQANPRAKFTWFKDDGTDLSTIASQHDYLDESILKFPSISVPCFGTYTLRMENRYGVYYAHYQIAAEGPPETPTNLHFSDVTYDSVKLQWTSGYDMGAQQHFIVMKLLGHVFIQISNVIYDNSPNHGINQKWTHLLDGLVGDTEYNLTVVSQNDHGQMSGFARPSVTFRTKPYPPDYNNDNSNNIWLFLGISLGTLGTLGFLAFIVYMVKYRRMRTSYDTYDEKKKIFQKN